MFVESEDIIIGKIFEMKVKLLNNTPLSIASEAIRTCWDSFTEETNYEYPTDNICDKDIDLMLRVIKRHKHQSTWEHCVYSFSIFGISRALLQELARHRIMSLSVKSTRYTLKELKNAEEIEFKNLEKYCVLTGNGLIDNFSFLALKNLQNAIKCDIKNDIAKYCLPESFKTDLRITINARSLQNMLLLRSDKSALWEFRLLAKELYNNLPEQHKFLFDIKEENNEHSI